MRQPFFEDLMTAMYPSGLLHTFGVNGKISGSVGAVGEMQDVLPIIHSPRGCGSWSRPWRRSSALGCRSTTTPA